MINVMKSNHQASELLEKWFFLLANQLFSGINCLHENFICHRDLKPNNVIVTEDLSDLKIIDFNASVSLNNRNYTRGRIGEIEFNQIISTFRNDSWIEVLL